jgi:hypothetical protein
MKAGRLTLQLRPYEGIKSLPKALLKEQYPSLYNITRKKHLIVASAFSIVPLNISFKSVLVGDKLLKWNGLVSRIAFVQLDDHRDSSGPFSNKDPLCTINVQNTCEQIALPLNKSLWKLKLPLKSSFSCGSC